MEHKIFKTEIILVEIVKTKPFNNGTWKETWNWEITMANHEDYYKGKALVANKRIALPWQELKSMNPLDEMIDVCKKYMETH